MRDARAEATRDEVEHPPFSTILEGGARAREHLRACAACRRLAEVAGALDEKPLADFDHLPTIERDVYVVLGEVPGGRGGMGRARRARDRRLGRVVVLKELLERTPGESDADRAELRARFEREARITARLDHPSIVAVHEAGRWPDGEPFLAMQLIDGEPLDAELARRPRLAERLGLLASFSQIADAVAYAHARGVVHRDIKPRNILLGPFGEAILIDWGLAKTSGEEDAPRGSPRDGLTQLGVGTPEYMAPEQARGAPVDARMDVYALGATLHHLLAGAPPYAGGRADEVRRALLAGPPRDLAALAPEVPRELASIVRRAMARDPAARFASARELAAELSRFQSGQLLATHRYTPAELLRHWARRHRTALRAAAALALAAVTGGSYAVTRVVRARDAADAARQVAENNQRAAHVELRRSRGLGATHLAGDPDARLDAIALGVAAVSADDGGEVPPEAARGLFDALAAGEVSARLGAPNGRLVAAIVRAGARRAVAVTQDRRLRVWDVVERRETANLAMEIAMPPVLRGWRDATRVVACGAGPIAETFDLARGTHAAVHHEPFVVGCGYLADGRLVTAADDVRVWNDDGAEAERLPLPARASALAVGDRGSVAVGAGDGSVIVWRAGEGAPTRVRPHTLGATAIAFAPGEAFVVSAGPDGRLARVDGDRARLLYAEPATTFLPRIAVSDDGAYALASAQPAGASDVIFTLVAPVDGAAPPRAYRTPSPLALDAAHCRVRDAFRVEPLAPQHGRLPWHGSAVGFVDDTLGDPCPFALDASTGQLRIFDARSGVASGVLRGHGGELRVMVRAGARLFTAGLDGRGIAWDAASGERVATFVAGSPLLGARALPGGRGFVAADMDGALHVIDEEGRASCAAHLGAPILAAGVDAHGERAAVASSDGAVRVIDLESCAAVRAIGGGGLAATAVAVSPDGARLAAGFADGAVRVWSKSTDAPIAETVAETRGAGISALVFADDATLVASAPASPTWLLDARDLSVRGTIQGRIATGWQSPLSPDRRAIALASRDGPVLVHDLRTGETRALEGHHVAVEDAAFSPDGRRVAAVDMQGTLSVWDLASGVRLASITVPDALGATAVVFHPSDDIVYVGFASGAVRALPFTTESAVRIACGVLDRLGRADAHCDATRNPSKAASER